MQLGFIFALIGHTLYAAVHVADRLVVTRAKLSEYIYAFWVGIIPVPVAIIAILLLPIIDRENTIIALLSGCAFTLGNIFHFRAMRYMEVTRVAPFVGAMTPVFTFLFARWAFADHYTLHDAVGIILLTIGSIIIGFAYPSKKSHTHLATGIISMVAAAALYAASFVFAKISYTTAPFLPVFAWGLIGSGLPAFALLTRSNFRRELLTDGARDRSRFEWILLSNKIFSAMAFVLLHLATFMGNPTVVQAMQGVQYMLVILIAVYMGKYHPEILNERLTRKNILVAIIAIFFILLGLYYLER